MQAISNIYKLKTRLVYHSITLVLGLQEKLDRKPLMLEL